jgi:hypothetical protein
MGLCFYTKKQRICFVKFVVFAQGSKEFVLLGLAFLHKEAKNISFFGSMGLCFYTKKQRICFSASVCLIVC